MRFFRNDNQTASSRFTRIQDELEENYLFPLYQMVVGRADDTLWYMYVTIGLYTLVPSLVHFKYELSKEYFFPISIGLFIYFWIVSFNCRFSLIISFVPYMGYFILGSSMYDYIHMKLRNELSNIIGVGLIISSYIVLLYVYTKCMGDFSRIENMYYFDIESVVATLLLFSGFSFLVNCKLKLNRNIINKHYQ